MSEIAEWLEANAEVLSALCSRTGLDERLVHLVAVLVLDGLDDRQIDAQVLGHGMSPGGNGGDEALSFAVREIRKLAA